MGRRLLGNNKEVDSRDSLFKIIKNCSDYRIFGLKMPGGNKSNSAGGRTQEFMVGNVAGDKRLAAERERIGEKFAARAAAQGDSLYASAAVAIANMAAESLRDKLRKLFWRKLFFELTRSEKHRSGIRGRNFANILKPQALRQNIVDAAVRTIEICMGADSVHAVFC